MEQDIVQSAINVLSENLGNSGESFKSRIAASNYFRLKLGEKKVETFAVMYLDARFRFIEFDEVATGGVDQTSANPRAIALKAIENCARFVILGHNHPSGDCEPSNNDVSSTNRMTNALELFDIHVLDHLVVARAPGFPCYSIELGVKL